MRNLIPCIPKQVYIRNVYFYRRSVWKFFEYLINTKCQYMTGFLCDHVSTGFEEYFQVESLHQFKENQSLFFDASINLKKKLGKLNEILNKIELPGFLYFARNADGKINHVKTDVSKIPTNRDISFLTSRKVSNTNKLTSNITPFTIPTDKKMGFIVFPMNEATVSKPTKDKPWWTSDVKNKGIVALPIGKHDPSVTYEDLKTRAPRLFENLEHFVKVASGIVSAHQVSSQRLK